MFPDATPHLLRYVIAGRLNRDYILPIAGPPQIDVVGGNLLYAAVGLRFWGQTCGMIAQVGQDYPLEWLEPLKGIGLDLSGIKTLPDPLDSRRFMAHSDAKTTHFKNPVQHFADRELSFPPGLLGYQPKQLEQQHGAKSAKPLIQISDIPKFYLDASSLHICPIDFSSHMNLPSLFRQGQATTITIASHPGYMSPTFWQEIPKMLSEITAFITTEPEIRSLFQGRQTELWEMAAVLADYGAELIIIHTDDKGVYLFDHAAKKRWVIPNYQANVINPTGAYDAFAGGFLVGYRETYDPLEATLMGNVAASFVVEGNDPLYALDALPRLVELRQTALRDLIQEH